MTSKSFKTHFCGSNGGVLDGAAASRDRAQNSKFTPCLGPSTQPKMPFSSVSPLLPVWMVPHGWYWLSLCLHNWISHRPDMMLTQSNLPTRPRLFSDFLGLFVINIVLSLGFQPLVSFGQGRLTTHHRVIVGTYPYKWVFTPQ